MISWSENKGESTNHKRTDIKENLLKLRILFVKYIFENKKASNSVGRLFAIHNLIKRFPSRICKESKQNNKQFNRKRQDSSHKEAIHERVNQMAKSKHAQLP